MNTYDEIMKQYLEMMSKAPEECQVCTRRHFIGCYRCDNQKYWENLNKEKNQNA